MSRELRRNCGLRGYRMKQAQRLSEARRRMASSRPRKLTAELWAWIEGKLGLQWSPEQIAGRMRLEGGVSVGKTWIYRQVWKDRADGGTLHRHLRRRGKKANRRGPRRRGPGRDPGPRGHFGASGGCGVQGARGRLGVGHDRRRPASGGAGLGGGPLLEVRFSSAGAAQDLVGGRGRGPGVPAAAVGAGAHLDGGQRQGVRGPPGGLPRACRRAFSSPGRTIPGSAG